jgi:phosphatidylserine/phosphatidylglycerophosphate/cardiolipin synthase-like enzyme
LDLKALEIKEEHLNRFGAALLFLVGKVVRLEDFGWVLSISGPNGDQLLLDELRSFKAIDKNGILLPGKTILWLLSKISSEYDHNNDYVKLVWTLPPKHPESGVIGSSYKDKIVEIIEGTKKELVLVSPFLAERGMATIVESLMNALYRGVVVIVITHSVEDLSSPQSRAIEDIRREASRMTANLTIYTSPPEYHHLLHAKLCISDRKMLALGSANLTGQGFSEHFEAGTVLGKEQAEEAFKIVYGLIKSGLARKTITTV